MPALTFECIEKGAEKSRSVAVSQLVVAGWTGRDRAAVEHHIQELAALGVPPPRTAPEFYHLGAGLVTLDDAIDVVGEESSGEVEAVLLKLDDGFWVGVGSDHTDRGLERAGIAMAKQVCPKPVAGTLWRYDDVKRHWDDLVAQSSVFEAGRWVAYQDGRLIGLLPPDSLVEKYASTDQDLTPGTLMFCGTQSVIGNIRHFPRFRMTLVDPVLNRSISREYTVNSLPT